MSCAGGPPGLEGAEQSNMPDCVGGGGLSPSSEGRAPASTTPCHRSPRTPSAAPAQSPHAPSPMASISPAYSISSSASDSASLATLSTMGSATSREGPGEGLKGQWMTKARHAVLTVVMCALGVAMLRAARPLHQASRTFYATTSAGLASRHVSWPTADNTSMSDDEAAELDIQAPPPPPQRLRYDVMWDPHWSCLLAARSPNVTSIYPNCGCPAEYKPKTPYEIPPPQPRLSFMDPSRHMTVDHTDLTDEADWPVVVQVEVKSVGPPCLDVLEAVVAGDEVDWVSGMTRQVALEAAVVASTNGTYMIHSTIARPGNYQLRVRLVWENFIPVKACRQCYEGRIYCPIPQCQFCRDAFFMTDSPFVNKTIHVLGPAPPPPPTNETLLLEASGQPSTPGESIPASDAETTATAGEGLRAGRPLERCRDLRDVMDGRWVDDVSQLMNAANISSVKPYYQLSRSWAPHTCYLQAYSPQELQAAFAGRHLLFVGDSTMHELMRTVMMLFGPPYDDSTLFDDTMCANHNRKFDSRGRFPTRFSFAWDGAPSECANNKGLWGVLDVPEGRERFISEVNHSTVDFVVANSGLHEVVGDVPLEDFDARVPRLFDLLLNVSGRIADRRDRFVWRSTGPFTIGHAKCDALYLRDGNAGIKWSNVIATKHVRSYGFPLMDVHRLFVSADYLRLNGGAQTCGDGVHCYGCEKCLMQALILVHQFMTTLE